MVSILKGKTLTGARSRTSSRTLFVFLFGFLAGAAISNSFQHFYGIQNNSTKNSTTNILTIFNEKEVDDDDEIKVVDGSTISNENGNDKDGGEEKLSTDANIPTTIVPNIKVDIYGGSISYGGGLHNSQNRFTDIIKEELKQAEVQNKAIGGAGPQHWLHCGIKPADVIVSEFRINEGNQTVLEKWYMMTSKYAQHTVVLDVWSWLSPPHITGYAATENALHKLKMKFPQINQTYSILSLSNRDKDSLTTLTPINQFQRSVLPIF